MERLNRKACSYIYIKDKVEGLNTHKDKVFSDHAEGFVLGFLCTI